MPAQTVSETEKKVRPHVPLIQCPGTVKAGELFPVKVTLSREKIHPHDNKPVIRWVSVYYYPGDQKFAFEIKQLEFSSCEEFTARPGNPPVYARHEVTGSIKIDKPGIGVIYATAYCATHGLRQSSREITISP
jgi:superoxide reductase